jgi:uncharacterized membrane protein
MSPFRHPRRVFVTGLLVVLPLLITGWLLVFLFRALDGPVADVIEALAGRKLPGLGLVLMLLGIFLVGLVASNMAGARLVGGFENLLLKIPLVRSIFGPAKQLFLTLAREDSSQHEVVTIEFPRPGLFMVGFVTRRDERGVTVFIPNTPLPTAGFLIICDAREVTPLDMPFDEAMQMIVSGGIVGPGAAFLPRRGLVKSDKMAG